MDQARGKGKMAAIKEEGHNLTKTNFPSGLQKTLKRLNIRAVSFDMIKKLI
jgi:hypothetical protein